MFSNKNISSINILSKMFSITLLFKSVFLSDLDAAGNAHLVPVQEKEKFYLFSI